MIIEGQKNILNKYAFFNKAVKQFFASILNGCTNEV